MDSCGDLPGRRVDGRLVVPLDHDPGEGLRPRIAHEKPRLTVERPLPSRQRFGYPAELVERRPSADGNVQQHLRALLDLGRQLGEWPARLAQRTQELEGGQEPVAGTRMVEEDNVAR